MVVGWPLLVGGQRFLKGHAPQRHRHAGAANPLYMPAIYIAQMYMPPLFICRHAAPLSHKHASQSATQWILESVQINPCKHIPQAIGDLDRLTSRVISFVQETKILLLIANDLFARLFPIICNEQATSAI